MFFTHFRKASPVLLEFGFQLFHFLYVHHLFLRVNLGFDIAHIPQNKLLVPSTRRYYCLAVYELDELYSAQMGIGFEILLLSIQDREIVEAEFPIDVANHY